MRPLADSFARTLTLVGGTLFVAFFSIAITLWTAPLLEADSVGRALEIVPGLLGESAAAPPA